MTATKQQRISIKRVRQLMGQLVVVDKVARREVEAYENGGRVTAMRSRDIKPRAGWVVGVRWLMDGMSVWESAEVGRVFEGEGDAVPHLLVCFWPSQRPVKVPLDGWRLRNRRVGGGADPLPWDGQWDATERALQAASASTIPRDERGRFV